MIYRSSVPGARFALGTALSVLLLTALFGCASGVPDVDSTNETSLPVPVKYHGPVPAFHGPYAAAFANAYRSTTSKLDHKILATNTITDQDYAAVGSVLVSCMAAQGYTLKLDSMVDTFEIEGAANTNAQMDAQGAALNVCEPAFDAVSVLYLKLLQNPENQDMNVLIEQCLVRSKVVPASYTVADYKADLQTQKFPFNVNSPAVHSCISSPLGFDVSSAQQ